MGSTALTLYWTSTADTTLTNASTLVANTTGAANVGVDVVTIGTGTGWAQLWFRGGQTTWPALGAIGTDDGHGAIWNVTTLEGQSILGGNWTPTIRATFNGANGAATFNITLRVCRYNVNSGVTTVISSSVTSGLSLTSTTATFALTAVNFEADFPNPGDRIYISAWIQITANANTAVGATFRLNEASSTTQGNVTNQLVTPGYNALLPAPTIAIGNVSVAAALLPWKPNIATGNVSTSAPAPGLGALPPIFPSINGSCYCGGLTRTMQIPNGQAIKEQYVKVYSASGQYICTWNDAPLIGWDNNFPAPKFAVNSVGSQITITLPRPFDSFDEVGDSVGRGSVGAGNIVQVWIVDNAVIPDGRMIYQGYIDGYENDIAADGATETLVVTISPFDTVLGDAKFIGTQIFGTAGVPATYIDPVTMFNWPYQNTDPTTGKAYTAPLTLDPLNPVSSGTAYQAQFKNQDAASWQEDVRNIAPSNWFWRSNPATLTVTFRQALATPVHSFIVGKHIAQPIWQKFYQNLFNDIYVTGTGTTPSRATSTDVNLYGRRTKPIVEPHLIDQTTQNHYAQSLLAQYDRVDYRSTIRIVDIRGDTTGAGYDIETITVGDTCRIINPNRNLATSLWDVARWDVDCWDFPVGAQIQQTVVIVGLTYGFDYVDLELSSLQPSQDRFLVDLSRQFEASQFN